MRIAVADRRKSDRLDVSQWLLDRYGINKPLHTLPEPRQSELRAEYVDDLHWHTCDSPNVPRAAPHKSLAAYELLKTSYADGFYLKYGNTKRQNVEGRECSLLRKL